MRFTAFVLIAGLFLAGCTNPNAVKPQTAKQMPPGYGIMVTSFKYVPGQSKFPKDQIIYDAKYTASRLSAVGYQAFIVYSGGNTCRVGVRASSHALAVSMQKQIDRAGYIDLKDGRRLQVFKSEIKNLAELQVGTVEDIK
jgi:hypothetical protein